MEVATTFFLSGLMDIALHPRFTENQFVYLTYNKPGPDRGRMVALARGRWDGNRLIDIQDLFVSDSRIGASRVTFGRDGMLYWAVGGPPGPADAMAAQDPMQHTGKILRLRDDGTVPNDNPFVGRTGYKPEIYTLGHRNSLGITLHPISGEIYETEQGPQGGDEVNVILAGRNYGWPVVSFGRWYEGPRVAENPYREGMELPIVYWVPSIATSGMTFYMNDKIPQWKGNLFVGSLVEGRIPQTGHIQRVVFNPRGEEIRRESLLTSLKQRMRDIREGPDGALYVLTDEDDAVLLRIDPVDATPAQPAPGSASQVPR
jgi:aldose sugar dehydrogenase